eukprot:356630-Chlamydomonas_euryale.AAC.9
MAVDLGRGLGTFALPSSLVSRSSRGSAGCSAGQLQPACLNSVGSRLSTHDSPPNVRAHAPLLPPHSSPPPHTHIHPPIHPYIHPSNIVQSRHRLLRMIAPL